MLLEHVNEESYIHDIRIYTQNLIAISEHANVSYAIFEVSYISDIRIHTQN